MNERPDYLRCGEKCGAFLTPDQNLICFLGVVFDPFVRELTNDGVSIADCETWEHEREYLIGMIENWLRDNISNMYWRSAEFEWAELDREQIEDFLELLKEAQMRNAGLVSFSF